MEPQPPNQPEFIIERPDVKGRIRKSPISPYLMKRLTKFEQSIPKHDQWYRFKTVAAIRCLKDRLTLNDIPLESRAAMSWLDLLTKYASQAWSTEEIPFAELLLFAACDVGINRRGLDKDEANSIMLRFLKTKDPRENYHPATLKKLRISAVIGIKALTIIAWYRGFQAFTLPCYYDDGVHCMSLFRVLTSKSLPQLHTKLEHRQDGFREHADLFIPNLLYELRGGSNFWKKTDAYEALDAEEYCPETYQYRDCNNLDMDSLYHHVQAGSSGGSNRGRRN